MKTNYKTTPAVRKAAQRYYLKNREACIART